MADRDSPPFRAFALLLGGTILIATLTGVGAATLVELGVTNSFVPSFIVGGVFVVGLIVYVSRRYGLGPFS